MNYSGLLRHCIFVAAFSSLMAAIALPSTSARAMSQSCVGTLRYDNNGLWLEPDAASKSPWCTASISDDLNRSLAKAVMRKCPIGSTCKIAGEFVGHGTFNWTKFTAVSLTKLDLPAAEELAARCATAGQKSSSTEKCMQAYDNAYGLFLTKTYQRLKDRLDAKARKALVDEQTKWLAEQSSACSAFAPNAKTLCLLRSTLERSAALHNRQ